MSVVETLSRSILARIDFRGDLNARICLYLQLYSAAVNLFVCSKWCEPYSADIIKTAQEEQPKPESGSS